MKWNEDHAPDYTHNLCSIIFPMQSMQCYQIKLLLCWMWLGPWINSLANFWYISIWTFDLVSKWNTDHAHAYAQNYSPCNQCNVIKSSSRCVECDSALKNSLANFTLNFWPGQQSELSSPSWFWQSWPLRFGKDGFSGLGGGWGNKFWVPLRLSRLFHPL